MFQKALTGKMLGTREANFGNPKQTPHGVVETYKKLFYCVVAFDPSDPQCYVSGEQYLIHKNYPEFVYYRDIVFYWKFFMATDKKAFPPVHEWTQKHAELKWAFEVRFVLHVGTPHLCTCNVNVGKSSPA